MDSRKFEIGFVISGKDHFSSVVGQAVRNADMKFKGLERGLKGFNHFSNKMFMGAAVIGAGIYKTVQAAEDANSSYQILENTMRRMWGGNGAAINAGKRMDEFAEKYQYQIGIEDHEINQVQSIIATYSKLSNRLGVTSGLFERLTKASFDMGSLFGDPAGNANALAIAMQDPIRNAPRLQRRGVVMKEDVPALQKIANTKGRLAAQMALMKMIERQFKGSAEKAAQPTKIMAIGINDISKTIGRVFLPSFIEAVKIMKKYMEPAKQFINTHKPMILSITKLGIKILAFSAGLRILSWTISPIIQLFKAFGILKSVITFIRGTAAAQWLLNASFLGCPIGWIVLGVAALGIGIYLLWKKFAWFRAGVKTAWEAIKGFGKAIGTYVYDRVIGLIKGIGALGRVLSDLFSGQFKKAWGDVKTGIDGITGFSATKKMITSVVKVSAAIPSSYRSFYAKESAKDRPTNRVMPKSKSLSVTYSPTVTINGNANKDDFKKMLSDHKTDIISIIDKNRYNQKRLSY